MKTLNDLPTPSKAYPLVGHALAIKADRLPMIFEAWADEAGPVYRLNLAGQPMVVFSDEAIINTALRERPDAFARPRKLQTIFQELNIQGVFNAEGQDWKKQRAIVSEALNPNRIKPFIPVLHVLSGRLVDEIKKHKQGICPLDFFQRFTIDVTTKFAFGYEANSIQDQTGLLRTQIGQIFPVISQRLNALIPYWRWIKLKKERELDKAMLSIYQALERIVIEANARLDQGHTPQNFLENMLILGREQQQTFSQEVIFGNLLTMLLAGEDTTANTMAWLAYYLALYPSMQAQAKEEIHAADSQQLESLPWLDALIHETLRLKSAAPLLFLDTLQDVTLGDIQIPRFTRLAILTRNAALQNENFAQAVEFKPERWLKDSGILPHNRKAFLPFGGGPRFCPGRYLSMLETKVLFLHLLQHFTIHPLPEQPLNQVEEAFSFTMKPESLKVEFRVR